MLGLSCTRARACARVLVLDCSTACARLLDCSTARARLLVLDCSSARARFRVRARVLMFVLDFLCVEHDKYVSNV